MRLRITEGTCLTARCNGTELRFEEIGLPEGAIVPRPGMAAERESPIVEFKTTPGNNLEGEPKSHVERGDLELIVISHRLIGPEMIFIFGSIGT